MRKSNIQSKVNDKLSKYAFNGLVRLRQITLKSKLEPTFINLTLVKFLLLISGLQEIQIVTETKDESLIMKNIEGSLVSIFRKFSINFINYGQDVYLLSVFLATEILYLFILTIIIFDKNEKFPLVKQTFKYFQIIFHTIVFLPLLNISFNFLLSLNYIGLPIMVIFLGLILENLFSLSNVQNSLIEIEGCFTIRTYNILNIVYQIALCFFVQRHYHNLITPLILLVSKLTLLYNKIYSFHYNSTFLLQITNFIIAYILTYITEQYWFDIALIYLLIINLQNIVRQRKLNIEISNEKPNLFYYQLYGNEEFVDFSPPTSHYLSTVYQKSIIKFEKYAIKQGNISERLAVVLHVFKFKKIQLYLNLITVSKENLNFNNRLNLEANLLNLIQICNKLITSQLNVPQFIKSLESEQSNFQLLIDFLNLKSQFYVLLSKDTQIEQYLKNFRLQLNKILLTLEKYKNIFEKQYDIQLGKLKQFKFSDSISINIVSAFLMVFYGNYFKVRDLLKQRNDLLQYDKVTNSKLQKNEVFLVQSSFIKGQGSIINKNNKRFYQIFGQTLEPKLLTDIMPPFQRNIYNNFISQYLMSGFDIQQPLQIFVNLNEFQIECELFVFVEISNDDIVIENLIILKNKPNHFVNFDIEGRILGISNEIFTFFTNKSENAFNKKLQIGDLISQGMIQYYMPEIYTHITDLYNQQKQGNLASTLWIVSRWQFPVNHKKCLEQTNSLGLVNDDCATPSQFKKIFYSSSTKRLVVTKSSQGIDELPIIKNVKIQIMQKSTMQQIQALVVPASRLKSIDFEGQLEFNVYSYANEVQCYFNIKFKQIEEYHQEKDKDNVEEKIGEEQNQTLNLRENYYDGIQSDYEFISNVINSKQLYTPLKYNIAIKLLMIFVTTTALVVCYYLNFENMVQYQEDVNLLNTPQAMTFNIAASFILQWNFYCVENNLYNISPYLEYKRENQIIYVFGFWASVHEEYSMNLSKKFKQLGYDNISLINYVNQTKYEEDIDFYQFYAVIREAMVRQYLKVDFKNKSTFDPTVLQTIGLVRQNMLKIYKFHDLVLDEVISQTQVSFQDFENKTFIFCIYSSVVIIVLLIIFIFVNLRLLNTQAKLVKLFQFLSQKQLSEELEYISTLKESLSRLLLLKSKQCQADTPATKNSEKNINTQQKNNPLAKLYYYREQYSLLIVISIVIGIELILFVFGSQLVAKLYNTEYQNSLLLTMKYLKLKCRVDSAVIIGEMMKTEHLIKNNTSMNFINESEHIEFFFDNIDVAVNLSNNINEELATTSAYNATFKQRLVEIFNENLCKYYASILSFCNIENIQLKYYDSENYISLIDNGIYGIVQDFNKLAKQEFSYEYVNLKYEYDQSHSQQFLNSPIHDHLFLQYFIEIQTCIYFCFVDIFAVTQDLSYNLSQQILIYLISSSGTFLFITSLISGFWISKQYRRLNQLKLIVTLFPPTLIQQKSFSKLLYSQLTQIE